MSPQRKMKVNVYQAELVETLSRLLVRAWCINKQDTDAADLAQLMLDLRYAATLEPSRLADFLALANSHHVTVRVLTALSDAANLGNEERIAEWCATALETEQSRIDRTVHALGTICDALESSSCKVSVIKSLDHWPDIGSDLDLYTNADPQQVHEVMRQQFRARAIDRSWGDRLANKWNYSVPDLPELVEIHVQYLGQTGEHAEIAQRVIDRRMVKVVGGRSFFVPANEERIVIATLQRMYRHFYFRLCDMIDVALLLQAGGIDFAELRRASLGSGIWPGVATFLWIVSCYVGSYGAAISLPDEVTAAAHSHQPKLPFRAGFLRVSKTTAAGLYAWQLLQAGVHRDVRALVRLPLLPPLAASALLVHSLSGNDKGIW